MLEYDPAFAPPAALWQAASDEEKLRAIIDHHRRAGITMANDRLHAAIHVVVENQLALGEAVVIDTMARLVREGLTRHDAIHAVGSVLVKHLTAALRSPTDKQQLAEAYLTDLADLTADTWRELGSS
jgi:hypothetical protein